MSTSPYSLFVLGHPLLDIIVTDREDILERYHLKANDAILAEAKHAPIYDEIVKEKRATYVAGGAAQNAARGAAYVLPPHSVVFTGCVGDDALAEQLKTSNKREGLDEVYLVKKGEKTGVCAVIVTGHDRSLVTDLRVAKKFELSHLSSPTVAPLVEAAKVFYVEGYILTHGLDCVLHVAQKASSAGKTFTLNLSAPYIPEYFDSEVQKVLPFTDILFSNEAEAEAYANANGIANKDLAAVAKHISLLPKANATRPRIVIFTHGAEATTLVSSADPDSPQRFPVHALAEDDIIDTNAAGDAFAGAFLGAYVSGKSLVECVEAGHRLSRICIGQVGAQYAWPKVRIF